MKILVIQDHLRNGGTERQSILLANAFAASHATTLLTFRPGGALAATVSPSVTHRALQSSDLGLDWFAPGLVRTVRALAPDVTLCMGRMANCHAGRLPGLVVGTMRTGKNLPWLYRRSLQSVSHIIANSAEARDTLVTRYAVPTGKISVIRNALVFPPATATRNDALRSALGATPATTVLLCVAMFRPEKNQRELIEIVSALPPAADWQLWLAGDGPARAACEALATARGLGARVKFLGFHRDPTPLYTSADLAVHTSRSEALSNFLIEAQAQGLPVVACEAQGIRECFLPEDTGWVIPRGDHAAFHASLLRLISSSPAERIALSDRARTFARTAFDPQRQVAAHLDLFQRLTSNP